jgi:hypothetical protein
LADPPPELLVELLAPPPVPLPPSAVPEVPVLSAATLVVAEPLVLEAEVPLPALALADESA